MAHWPPGVALSNVTQLASSAIGLAFVFGYLRMQWRRAAGQTQRQPWLSCDERNCGLK